ncbi:MAG: hypothetical protein MI741_24305 [Rhodospirillales bacterium]|nr:hypothetical protein [Rhodospirillales bacterium]
MIQSDGVRAALKAYCNWARKRQAGATYGQKAELTLEAVVSMLSVKQVTGKIGIDHASIQSGLRGGTGDSV